MNDVPVMEVEAAAGGSYFVYSTAFVCRHGSDVAPLAQLLEGLAGEDDGARLA
ncbi:MAG: hypothetical protein AB8I08_37415 [Sandaracinaceae bacterium]